MDKQTSDARFKRAGVGIKSDATVALALGVTKNAVAQYRHRRRMPRPIPWAVARIVRDQKPSYHVYFHVGVGVKYIRFHGGRELPLGRFLMECRLGRSLRKDEIARNGRVYRS